MKRANYFILTLLLLLTGTKAFSQLGMGNREDIEALRKRPLIVAMIEPSNSITIEQAEKYNKALTEAVKTNWTMHKTVEYKSISEVNKLYKAKDKNYGVIKYEIWEVKQLQNGQTIDKWEMGTIGVSLIENSFSTKLPYIYCVNVARQSPTQGDFLIAIKSIQVFIDHRASHKSYKDAKNEIAIKANLLKTKTLLIDKNEIGKSLKPDDIKQVYPYKYRIVDYAEIEKAIIEKNSEYAIVHFVPANIKYPDTFVHYVLDTQNLETLGYSAPPAIGFSFISYGGRVSKSSLKDYQQLINN